MNDYDNDDEELNAMFEGIEPRPAPSPESTSRAFAAVEEEWEILQARHKQQPRRRVLAVAAMLLVGVLGTLFWQQLQPTDVPVQFAQGKATIGTDSTQRTVEQPQDLVLVPDFEVASIGTSRWVVAGADVRLAGDARVKWKAANEIELLQGDLYIATHGDASFVVETAYGRVTDIGTRFIVSANANGVEVAVREGIVRLASKHGERDSKPNSKTEASVLTVTSVGITESTETRSNERWAWIHSVPAGYTSDEPLVLLRQIAQDLGKDIEFASAGVKATLSSERVGGDFTSMTPLQAVKILARTTGIEWQEEGDTITVNFKD